MLVSGFQSEVKTLEDALYLICKIASLCQDGDVESCTFSNLGDFGFNTLVLVGAGGVIRKEGRGYCTLGVSTFRTCSERIRSFENFQHNQYIYDKRLTPKRNLHNNYLHTEKKGG